MKARAAAEVSAGGTAPPPTPVATNLDTAPQRPRTAKPTALAFRSPAPRARPRSLASGPVLARERAVGSETMRALAEITVGSHAVTAALIRHRSDALVPGGYGSDPVALARHRSLPPALAHRPQREQAPMWRSHSSSKLAEAAAPGSGQAQEVEGMVSPRQHALRLWPQSWSSRVEPKRSGPPRGPCASEQISESTEASPTRPSPPAAPKPGQAPASARLVQVADRMKKAVDANQVEKNASRPRTAVPPPLSKRGMLRRASQGSFKRQSIADIFAEARALERRMQGIEEGTPYVQSDSTASTKAVELHAVTNQAESISPEDQVSQAAATEAAARIGKIMIRRCRSRSTSPRGIANGDAALPGQASNIQRTPSSEDADLDNADKLDEIAQQDAEYRENRRSIRQALRDFSPSVDDWKSIDFFNLPEPETRQDVDENWMASLERELKEAEASIVPENPENVPGWQLVRTIFGSQKWFNFDRFKKDASQSPGQVASLFAENLRQESSTCSRSGYEELEDQEAAALKTGASPRFARGTVLSVAPILAAGQTPATEPVSLDG